MNKTILLATNNSHKVEEIKNALTKYDLDYDVLTLKDLNVKKEPIEDGETFYDNALIKASFYKKMFPQYLVLADDTGLLVDFLNGKPGVHSKRYSAPYATPKKNRKKLLLELNGVDNRNAHFETVMVFIDQDNNVHSFTGATYGMILDHEEGSNGFGYDALFYSTEINKPFGLITLDEKNQISHRGRALDKFASYLKEKS